MTGSNDKPYHVRYAQEKAEWEAKHKEKYENANYVIITDIDIPFSKLISFMGVVGLLHLRHNSR